MLRKPYYQRVFASLLHSGTRLNNRCICFTQFMLATAIAFSLAWMIADEQNHDGQ